jgi:outer membrane protein OmpA-like peptidoglycan-associated protein/tetratricopeptide (TPR) repeat protein
MKTTSSMFKKFLLTALVVTLGLSAVSAQSGKLKRAKKLYEGLAYIEAIELYNQILEKGDNAEAKIYLADAYRKINDTENAEYWYGQVVRLSESQPIHKLYYGQMLQRNGKCDLAKEWYEQYVEAVPDEVRAQYLVRGCDYEEELMTKNVNSYETKHLPFNSNLDDFSPGYYQGGLVFASERDKGSAVKREHTWTGNPFLELFFVDMKAKSKDKLVCQFEYGRPKKYSKEVNEKFHEAAVSFSSDQNEIFYTANNYEGGSDDGTRKLKIYSAKSEGENKWGKKESLPFNSDEYSVAHPSLTADGNRLYFASDMPGGFGGMDLYYSDFESGRWGPPTNLGPAINTEGHEIFPYYGPNSRLYFSSDGHIGLGGLDIFYIVEKGEGEWSAPENIGFPLNSNADDFGIIFNEEGTCGFFSSDREGGSGRDDIYSFVKTATPVEIFVFDEDTKLPLKDASVTNACTGENYTTDEEGKVMIDMKLDTCCNFAASYEGYNNNDKEACTKGVQLGDLVRVEIPLKRNLTFDIEGIVFDQQTGLPLEGVLVEISNDCDKDAPEAVTTDASGQFQFDLDADCCYTLKASKDGYLVAILEDQCTRDLTESTTLQANINLQPFTSNGNNRIIKDPNTGLWIDSQTGEPADGNINGFIYKNGKLIGNDPNMTPISNVDPNDNDGRVHFLLHIYYDFNQSYVREDAVPELEKLLSTLELNPDLIIEIGSHTDSRGTYRYNNRLSQRRAESIVRWLSKRGIDKSRLVAKGYGERVNVNDCSNNVPCSEEEHQYNRRTEFKVIGCQSCDYLDKTISAPSENVTVDPCVGCPFDD